jgi:small conductance mechanosensitive channel
MMQISPHLAIDTVEKIINGFFAILPKIAIAIVVFLIFFFVARGINALIRRAIERNKMHQNLALVLGRLSEWVILLTEPFDLGDQIIVGDFEGTVESIETRATLIKTYDGRRVVIPNAQLFTQSVTVNTAYETRRLETEFYIVAATDAEQAKRATLDAITGVDGVIDDPPPDVLAVGFESAGVTLRARWWIKPPRRGDAMATRDRVVTAIHQALTAHNIALYNPNA